LCRIGTKNMMMILNEYIVPAGRSMTVWKKGLT
jgi:hypothetical protein